MIESEHKRAQAQFDKYIAKQKVLCNDMVDAMSRVIMIQIEEHLKEQRMKKARNEKFGL